jgi:hypothetical protein
MERMERIEDLDLTIFRAQGIVGVGVIILISIVLPPLAVLFLITRAGSLRDTRSSCR